VSCGRRLVSLTLGVKMSIGNRIDEAIEKLKSGDFENALIQISIAIDATATKKFNNEKKVGKRVRNFIMEYQDYLMHFQMDGRVKIATAAIYYGDKGSLGDVLYKSIRCALLHNADISDQVVFKPGSIMGMEYGKFIVSEKLLWGLVLILIGQEVNARQSLKSLHKAYYDNTEISLNDMWGKEEAIKSLVHYVPIEDVVKNL
jgi:hypothetical protein